LRSNISVNRLDDAPSVEIFFFPTSKARKQYADAAGDSPIDSDGDGDFDNDDLATADLASPPEAGEYEIRYTLSSPNIILARRPLTVTDSQYSLEAPAQVPVATAMEITWQGPLTPGDILTIVPEGDERTFDNARYTPLKEGQPAQLTSPAQAGEYEIRYVMYGGYTTYPGMHHAVQLSVPLTVTDVTAELIAPAEAVGGSTIDVEWTGPAEDWQDDFISVVLAGNDKFNRMSRANLVERDGTRLQPVPIRVPAIEGDYEVVYLISPGNRIIARTPITIKRAQATLDAPDRISAGSDIEVSWTGDAFRGDRIVLVKAEVPDLKMWGVGVNYGFPADPEKPTGTIAGRVSKEPGEYEVRYVTGLEHQVLARAKITITE
jgi:Ca-activated chloride channel family protein